MPSSIRVRRALPWAALGFTAAAVIAILLVDRPLARFYAEHGVEARQTWTDVRKAIDEHTGLTAGEWFTDDVTGLELHEWFVATVFVIVGAIALVVPRLRATARVWWFAAAVHVIARLLTNEGKELTGRLRPFQWVERGGATFGEGGVSFPSGHASYYLGLVLPFAVAWPRIGLPLLIVPAFVAWSRVAVNAHFVADILASGALVSLLTWALAHAFRIDGRPRWRR